LRGASSFQDRFFAVALPPLRPAAFFCAVVPPREELEREVVDRVLEVVDAERERVVPEVDRDREVPDVERLAVLDVDRALLVLEVDRRFAAVVRPPLAPAAFFCAVVPPRLEVERDVVREPDVDRARDVVERDEPALDRDFAAVARPPLAPAAFFWAVLPPLADVDRLEVVLDFARLDVARGEAARTREIEASSSVVPSTGASSGSSKGGSCGLSVSK
jgi:hypothetical protein